MTSEEKREIAVGVAAFVIVIAAIVAVQYRAALPGPQSSDTYSISATFNRAEGVAEGTPVRVSGIPVGEVEKLDLTADYRVRVSMAINRSIELPVDSSVAIETDGLFGPKSVRIEPGGSLQNLTNGGQIEYAQDPLLVSDLLDLIIAEGRAARAGGDNAGGQQPETQ